MHSMYDTITRQETRLLSKFASSQYSSPEGKREAGPIDCQASNAQFKSK